LLGYEPAYTAEATVLDAVRWLVEHGEVDVARRLLDGGRPLDVPTGALATAIVTLEHGDPDGGGDLKGNNQIAYRVEGVIYVAIFDLDAFAAVDAPTA
ncbi:hypothetical protein IAE22_28100, partial [Bacillus sp. S34]|nr:hypothetical protein [Bacillus sp. S34]